jgi:hypothetical protein
MGLPLMVTGVTTRIENGASEALEAASLTVISMFANVPASAALGVPESWPVLLSKLAQLGAFVIENVRVSPACEEEAVGVKLYVCPAMTLAIGDPEMVSVEDCCPGGGGTLAIPEPSLDCEPDTPT